MDNFHVWIQMFDLFWRQSTLLIDKPWQEVLGTVLFLTPSTTITKLLPVQLCYQSRGKNKSMLSWQYNIKFLCNATELVLKTKGINFTPMWVYAIHTIKSFFPISSQRQQSIQVSVCNLIRQYNVVCPPVAGAFSFWLWGQIQTDRNLKREKDCVAKREVS